MAALTAITPVIGGVASTGAAVAASDTIAASVLGTFGAFLEILNGGGSTDTITITDAGTTGAGNSLSGGTYGTTVTAGAVKIFRLKPEQVTPSTGLITITHSFTTSVTYKLYPVGPT
jgi:hypothetical protein